MEWQFYDVRAKAGVKVEVTGKKVYGEGAKARYAFKGVTADGRPLNAFVKKEVFDKCKAKIVK